MDKPAAAKAPYFALSDHELLLLEGRDAIAFIQAQCMSDVATLADGQWQWSGWLTPKGRVQALFLLLRAGPESVWLLLPDGGAAGLKAAMERFVFRSKVRLRVPEDMSVCGSFSAPAAAAGAMSATDAKGRVELDLGDGTEARTLRICTGCSAPVDADALARWRAFDLAHGLPRPGARAETGAGTLEAWTPQQLSLERLKAYSVRKGCYPGQEIVARTHFLGQAKRGLALFGSDAVPVAGAQVMAGERALGCDPAIADLLTELRERPDERRCRAAARQALTPPVAASGRVVSVYERAPTTSDAPLTAAEVAALTGLPLPGELVLSPDLAPRPGVPATTATLAGAALQVDADGRLRGSAAPGRHTLEVRHANDRGAACVTLTACSAVALTAHGALLAPHPAVVAGPCEP